MLGHPRLRLMRSSSSGLNGDWAEELKRRFRFVGSRWRAGTTMSFCDHCEGQRFDRAQVLRVLRATRKLLRKADTVFTADQTMALAIEAVRTLDIPHLELAD